MLDQLLPSAEQVRAEADLRAAEKAYQFVGRLMETELEKQALLDKVSGRGDDYEKLDALSNIIERAADSGLDEVLLCRFPASICRDGGRAVANAGEDWENTLTGAPKRLHDLWLRYLKPRGYTIRYTALQADRNNTEIHIVLSWGD